MNFLPLEDIEVVWVHEERDRFREGHAWYDGQYCRFERDSSQGDPDDRTSCPIYLLYAMKGQTLAKELARRFESGDDGALLVSADFGFRIRAKRALRSEELRFVGRFIGPPSQQDRSVDFNSNDEDKTARPRRTWFAPIARAFGGVLHRRPANHRVGRLSAYEWIRNAGRRHA